MANAPLSFGAIASRPIGSFGLRLAGVVVPPLPPAPVVSAGSQGGGFWIIAKTYVPKRIAWPEYEEQKYRDRPWETIEPPGPAFIRDSERQPDAEEEHLRYLKWLDEQWLLTDDFVIY